MNIRSTWVWLLALVLISWPLASAMAPTASLHAPHIPGKGRNGTVGSYNWSGYAVTASSGSVSYVKGSWKVPTVSCSAGENSYSSFWAGIDGYSSSTVEQAGTDSDCRNGVPTYYAWYEFYPKPASVINLAIHPGDIISVEVKDASGQPPDTHGNHAGDKGPKDPKPGPGITFTLTITDVTTGNSFSTSATVKAQRSSAECIAEAPSSGSTILPLADFGTAFVGASCDATINGVTAAFGSFGASVQQIIMFTFSGDVKAQPSALSADGTSFSVQWLKSGP